MVAWLSAYSMRRAQTALVLPAWGVVRCRILACGAGWWLLQEFLAYLEGVLGALAVGLLVWLIVGHRPAVQDPKPLPDRLYGGSRGSDRCGVPQEFVLPEGLAVNLAYAIIGIQAGGTLTKGALRQFSAALPMLLGVLLLMVASSLATGWFIAWTSDFDILDAYLATVPGGVYAVLAFAHDSGSDPLVTVVQVLRVLVMLIAGAFAPTVIDWLRRTGPTRQTGSPSHDAADHPTVR